MSKQVKNATRESEEHVEGGSAGRRGTPQNNPIEADAILAANLPRLLQLTIQRAYDGDRPALRQAVTLAVSRDQKRASKYEFTAPLDTREGLVANGSAVLEAFGRGELSFEKAAGIHALLASQQNSVQRRDEQLNDNDRAAAGAAASPQDFADPFAKFERTSGIKTEVMKALAANTNTPKDKE